MITLRLSKVIVLQILILTLFACTGRVKDQPPAQPTPQSPTPDELTTKWNQMTGDTSQRIRDTEKVLDRDSKTFGIESLKQSVSPPDCEIRVWSDQEALLHCLLISERDGKWKASMISGDTTVNRKTRQTYLKKTRSSDNLTPKSGWKEVGDGLERRGIRFPLALQIDEINKPPEPDEGLVKLELRSGKQYGLVFYQKLSDSNDAKKVIELCSWLQGEFSVDLGC